MNIKNTLTKSVSLLTLALLTTNVSAVGVSFSQDKINEAKNSYIVSAKPTTHYQPHKT